MKLVYTDITQNITKLLSQEAANYAKTGKRVFYIAPNSLSFEKEKTVLEMLDGNASFDIIVTRFAQMARYFILNEEDKGESLDDIGMVLLVTRVLRRFEATDLKVYSRLKDDANFVQQICDLYHEFSQANMTLEILESLNNKGKAHDLSLIFQAIDQELIKLGYEKMSKIQQFIKVVKTGHLTETLANTVLIIDGFTRFSAEEEELVALLNEYCAEVVVAAYASKEAISSPYLYGDAYEASVTFLKELQMKLKGQLIFLEGDEVDKTAAFSELSQVVEDYYSGRNRHAKVSEQVKKSVSIWEAINQREEMEEVARAIRSNLDQGKRYKDHLILLGDVEAYHLQLAQILEKYQIPYYFGKAESMAHHPLVNVIDAIDRLYRYNFRHEDVIILMTSGLIYDLTDDDIDLFERYVHFMDLRGKSAFQEPFTKAENQFPELESINETREKVLTPLIKAFSTKSQTIKNIIKVLSTLLENLGIMSALNQMNALADEINQEKNDQVWKQFCHILEEMVKIFEDDKDLSFGLILTLLKTAMLNSEYRIVPATVDVVSVKSYDLIAPHTNDYIYALGLTQSNFPKQAVIKSILTEEERQLLNVASQDLALENVTTKTGQYFQLVSEENHKKNRFVAMSLYNSANKQLVLSVPQIYKENQDELSIYLRELNALGIEIRRIYQPDFNDLSHFAHYRAILSQFIRINQQADQVDLNNKEKDIWRVLLRRLKMRLEHDGVHLPRISKHLSTSPLSQETLHALYPDDSVLNLSVSSLTDFNSNPYTYYLKHILHLQEMETAHPDARSHGNFLHRIFERVMVKSGKDFDQRLEEAIKETEQEQIFKLLYEYDDASLYTRDLLVDIARSTATVLRDNDKIEVREEEAEFGSKQDNLFQIPNHSQKLNVLGKIDRLDHLKDSQFYGLVDYKSSDKNFDFSEFYNGMGSQLVTYIDAVRRLDKWKTIDKVFAAVYLRMVTPIIKLEELSDNRNALDLAVDSLKYKGLYIDSDQTLNHFYQKTKDNTVSEEDLKILIAYNRYLFERAAHQILKGQFPIAPYSKDHKSVSVEQYKSISHYESTLHFGQARKAERVEIAGKTKRPKKEDWIAAMSAIDRVQAILKEMDEEED